jgi:hypothetical protein
MVQLHAFIASVLDRGELHARSPLYTGMRSRYSLSKKLGGPQSRSGRWGGEKVSFPWPEANSDSSVVRHVAQWLCRQSCPGSFLHTATLVKRKHAFNRNWRRSCESTWKPMLISLEYMHSMKTTVRLPRMYGKLYGETWRNNKTSAEIVCVHCFHVEFLGRNKQLRCRQKICRIIWRTEINRQISK